MARRGGKRKKRQALGPQAHATLERASQKIRPARKFPSLLDDPGAFATMPGEARAKVAVALRKSRTPPRDRFAAVLAFQAPRQKRLEIQRPAVRRVLAKGGPLSQRDRDEARREVSQHLRELICRDRKVRRQMVFATRSQGAKGGKRPKQRSIFSDIKC